MKRIKIKDLVTHLKDCCQVELVYSDHSCEKYYDGCNDDHNCGECYGGFDTIRYSRAYAGMVSNIPIMYGDSEVIMMWIDYIMDRVKDAEIKTPVLRVEIIN